MQTDGSWPRTPEGTIDWEVVFEDEKTGLISLVTHAHSPDALREGAMVIVRKLFGHQEDHSEVARLTAELKAAVPLHASAANLDTMRERVTRMLRRVKDERKRAAHAHPARRHVGRRPARRFDAGEGKPAFRSWISWLALGLVAAAGVALMVIFSKPEDGTQSASRLVDHMELAVIGAAPPFHSFGGALRVETRKGIITVTAEGVPQKACVNAAWELLHSGRVAVNGTMPPRVTAAILSELCARDEKGATITWITENTKGR